VQDIPRVLRVPGTLNAKYDPPRPVRIVQHNPAALYTLDDFEVLLPAPIEPERPAWSPPTYNAGRSAYADIPSLAEMREILSFTPPQRTYQEWQTTLAAVHSVYPGPEGVALCESWSPGKPGEIARKFASFKRDGGASDAASIGTLIYIAKQHGYQPPVAGRAQASPKFATTEIPDDGDVQDVLQMAVALDTARRQIAELEGQLDRCRDEHKRKDALIEVLQTTVAAYEASTVHPDQTIGGSAFDLAEAAVTAYERGDTLVQDGKEYARVVCKAAARRRSAGTLGRAIKKIAERDPIAVLTREEEIETDGYRGTIPISYIHIPEDRRTPAKAVLTLLPPAGEKKHGGNRRKFDLPDFGEVVEGPIEIKTEKKQIYTAVAAKRVLKVTPLETHTEYCDSDGYQLTADEVDTFRESIGEKIKVRTYRPQAAAQMPLTPADAALFERDELAPVDTRRPVPLHGECAWGGCSLPALKGQPLCARHAPTYAMTGAD
jgi:hypothetical protein